MEYIYMLYSICGAPVQTQNLQKPIFCPISFVQLFVKYNFMFTTESTSNLVSVYCG